MDPITRIKRQCGISGAILSLSHIKNNPYGHGVAQSVTLLPGSQIPFLLLPNDDLPYPQCEDIGLEQAQSWLKQDSDLETYRPMVNNP